jgi:hypothetical protein
VAKKPKVQTRKEMDQRSSAELQKVDYDTKLDLYRQRAKDLAAKSQGLERFIYKLFGVGLMASWALALDPWERFTITANKVAKLTDVPTHHRKRLKISTPYSDRFELWSSKVTLWDYVGDASTPNLFDYLQRGPVTTKSGPFTTIRQPQLAITGFIRDFTEKNRGIGVRQGEMEIFDPVWKSFPLDLSFQSSDNWVQTSIGGGSSGVQRTRTVGYRTMDVYGPEIACDKTSTLALETSCRTRALAQMQANALGMLDKCLPISRDYNLFYQVVELKDLPQTIRGSLQAWQAFESYCGTELFRSLQHNVSSWRNPALITKFESFLGQKLGWKVSQTKTFDQVVSDAFLTFKFGWQSMVQAVSQLLRRPEEITKRVNFLVDNIGRDVSFRTKKSWLEPVSSFPTFSGQVMHYEDFDSQAPLTSSGTRQCELRCVANVCIQFPKVDLPKLRSSLFAEKLGLYPSPSDIYDLVPWTWMIDWFSGLGDYVHIMDTIRKDRSIVNYSFMTYREVSNIRAHFGGKYTGTWFYNFDGSISNGSTTGYKTHVGVLNLTYHLRKSMDQVASVKTYWDPSLSGSQKAIIGALSTKYGSPVKHRA